VLYEGCASVFGVSSILGTMCRPPLVPLHIMQPISLVALATLPFHAVAFTLPSLHIDLRDPIRYSATKNRRPLTYRQERTTSEELIPLKTLFGNPENTSPILSPDGKYLAYLAPSDEGVLNIYVRDLDGVAINSSDGKSISWNKSQDRLITNEPKRGIRSVAWAYDNTTIFYMQDTDGNEDFHLYAVDITQPSSEDGTPPAARDLTPGVNVKAQNIITNHRYPNEILVGTNERNSKVFDMYRCFYKTGEKYLDTINPGDVIGWKTEDTSFEIRAATVRNAQDSSTTIRVRKSADIIGSDEESTEWRNVFHFPYGEEGGLLDFCPDQTSAYLTSSLGRETTALLKVNVESGEILKEIYSNDRCNVGGVTLDKNTKEIKALTYNYARTVRIPSTISVFSFLTIWTIWTSNKV
jgi:hypothetical protein